MRRGERRGKKREKEKRKERKKTREREKNPEMSKPGKGRVSGEKGEREQQSAFIHFQTQF